MVKSSASTISGRPRFFASQFDQRFSYCLYVPEDYDEDGTETHELLVIIHGTGRTAAQYRDHFANFARENRCIVLAPLFPAGIVVKGDLANYKRIEFQGIRFDHILLSMIDEVAAKYRLKSNRALMYGFFRAAGSSASAFSCCILIGSRRSLSERRAS